MKTIYAKPAEGLQVRKETNPDTHVASDGEELPASTYYLRRVACGDLVEIERPTAKPSGRKPGKES